MLSLLAVRLFVRQIIFIFISRYLYRHYSSMIIEEGSNKEINYEYVEKNDDKLIN